MSPWSLLQQLFTAPALPPSFRERCVVGTMARGSLIKCVAGLLTLQGTLSTPVTSKAPYSSQPILGEGQLGAVASESDICSHIGIDLLKLGGNAADAMVGVAACVGVVGMYHSGKFNY